MLPVLVSEEYDLVDYNVEDLFDAWTTLKGT